MKKLTLILTLLFSLNIMAQKRTKIFFRDYVECFYSKKATESIIIFNSPNGEKTGELQPLENNYCWYKFAISESKNGWLKIENVIVLPDCEENELNKDISKYKGNWILANNMKIFLPDLGENSGIKMNFYESPSKSSKIIFSADDYLSTELIAVSKTWAKLRFKFGETEIIGWLERKYQCSYPWTNCPIWE